MIVTERTREALRIRRERRRLLAAGFEYVDDRGGRLWELDRGYRWRQKITDVVIDPHGQSLWVKIA